MSDAAIRGVLFDSGDTLVGPRGGRWNPRFDFESVLLGHGVDAPAYDLTSAFAAGEDWLRSSRATSSRDDYHRVILAQLGVEPTAELLAELSAPLDVPVFETFPEAVAVLDRLRDAGMKLAIVTNNWGTTKSFLSLTAQVGLGPFDACVVSAEIGYAKPDARIYLRASELLGLRPDECLFVDDTPRFVAAALKLGYYGVTICRSEPAEDPIVPSVRSLEEILPLVGLPTEESRADLPRDTALDVGQNKTVRLREAWDSEAAAWIAFARSEIADPVFYHFNLPAFLPLLPEPGALTVDVGCGEGRVSRALQRLGHHVLPVDVVPAFVDAAAAHSEASTALLADAAALPLAGSSADLVVLFMVLHDVDDMPATLREAARILTAGGRACIAIGHPVQGAGDHEGPDRSGNYVMDRSYFEERRLTYMVDRGGRHVELNFTHRPLEAYTRALEEAGFLIESLREPRPSDPLSSILIDAAQRRRVPSLVHIRAKKL